MFLIPSPVKKLWVLLIPNVSMMTSFSQMYIRLRRYKKILYNKAYNVSSCNLQKRAFAQWRQTICVLLQNKEQEEIAGLHDQNITVFKVGLFDLDLW